MPEITFDIDDSLLIKPKPFCLTNSFVLFFLFLIISLPLHASTDPKTSTNEYLFLVSHPGAPPYLYKSNHGDKYVGIVPDIMRELEKAHKVSIKFKPYNRLRGEMAVVNDQADMALISKAWVKSAEKLIFSKAILQHRSFLYQSRFFAESFELDKASMGTKICTRRVFTYPVLEPYFKQNKLTRIDSASQQTMLKMLFAKRCNMAILNEYNAQSLMLSDEFKQHQLFPSPQPISHVELNIAIRDELTDFKVLLDQTIDELKHSGRMNEIINFHASNKAFGKM